MFKLSPDVVTEGRQRAVWPSARHVALLDERRPPAETCIDVAPAPLSAAVPMALTATYFDDPSFLDALALSRKSEQEVFNFANWLRSVLICQIACQFQKQIRENGRQIYLRFIADIDGEGKKVCRSYVYHLLGDHQSIEISISDDICASYDWPSWLSGAKYVGLSIVGHWPSAHALLLARRVPVWRPKLLV
jgi:hypothetical protein